MNKNLQYLRTDRAIINAFLELMKTKPFEKITVQDILDEAMVNRSTFYAHFRDKYDIAEQLQTRYVDELRKTIIEAKEKNPVKYSEINQFTTAYFIKNRTTLKALMKIKTEQIDIISEWNKLVRDEYLIASNSPNADLEANMYANIATGFLTCYIEKDNLSSDYPELFLEVFLNVVLKILTIDDDTEVKEMLTRRIIQKNSAKKRRG